ncbi:MAG: hypothetical protein IPL28_06025 [Chloroflexi bacterium]|nr:hypothetical protein [Chloroflexota bacterium]
MPLAAVRDDDCLLPALVQALNLPEDKAQNALDQLANYLTSNKSCWYSITLSSWFPSPTT